MNRLSLGHSQESLGCTPGIPVAPSVLARQACLPQNHELSQVGTLLYLGFHGYSALHVVSKNTDDLMSALQPPSLTHDPWAPVTLGFFFASVYAT